MEITREGEELHVLSLCFRFVFNLHDLLGICPREKIELKMGGEIFIGCAEYAGKSRGV